MSPVASPDVPSWPTGIHMSFSELGLSEKVLSAVAAAGYTKPTPIQEQAIPHVLARKDVLGIAQTGTGKTAAFTLPMITILENGRARARMPRTLILEPTRELAAQVEENFNKYGVDQKLSVALIIGGVSFGDQDLKIMRGVDVLIATPGRLLDHVERGKLLLTGVELLVIDEADRMLDMGFIPDIERIVKLVPFTRQTLFFSATMPPEIQRLADQFLHNPVKIEVERISSTAETITQRIIHAGREPEDKRNALRNAIRDAEDFKNAIIFCNRKRDVSVLHRALVQNGFKAVALHGDLDQRTRTNALESFRNGEMQLLVASDVAARGLDIPDVSHVFNFDVPHHAEDYVHRIGRTGRAGRKGTSITLITSADTKALAAIEKLIGRSIEWEGAKPGEAATPSSAKPDAPTPRAGRGGKGPDREDGESKGRGRSGGRRPAPSSSRETASPREHDASVSAELAPKTSQPAAQAVDAPASPRQEPFAPRASNPTSERHAPRDRPQPRYRDHADDGDDKPVQGLGEHVPAFFLRTSASSPVRKRES
jgi:superfamily II DNA/RNA helicase